MVSILRARIKPSSILTCTGRPIRRAAILIYCLFSTGCIGTDLVGEIPEDDGPSSITISSSTSAVEIGQEIQYEAVFYHFDGSIDQSVVFEWVSSNSDVATVDATGSASALSAGQAMITAHALGVDSHPLTLTVVADVNQVAIVQLTPEEIVLTPFETAQLTATLGICDWPMIWISSPSAESPCARAASTHAPRRGEDPMRRPLIARR